MDSAVDRLNWLNIGLMLGAAAAALAAPFHVFVVAYAVLGPLHYLTQISWLHDRQYFTPWRRNRRSWLVMVAATAVVMTSGYVAADLLRQPVPPTFEIGMFLLVFLGAGVAVYAKQAAHAVGLMMLAAVAVAMFARHPAYGIVAYLLITIVHVFVFTAGFILSGAIRSRSPSGYASVAVLVACALAVATVDVPFGAPPEPVRTVYAGFEQLNALLLHFLSRSPGEMYEAGGAGVMRLIAFAYLYHYLNWFSKTSTIRWHEVPRARALGIVALWLAGSAIYYLDYRVGFAVFYGLSVTHVMLEFPLDYQVFSGLGRSLLQLRRAAP